MEVCNQTWEVCKRGTGAWVNHKNTYIDITHWTGREMEEEEKDVVGQKSCKRERGREERGEEDTNRTLSPGDGERGREIQL